MLGEYSETAAGKTHSFTPQPVRYVREYLNGSTANSGNHWVEIEVWGTRTTEFVGNYYEWNTQAGTGTSYYYAGGTRVAMRRNGAVTYIIGDHLGSTQTTVNDSGVKVSEMRYKAYGEMRYSGPPTGTPTNYRFTGQQQSAALGLYHMGARWYDPYLGRWISPDPVCPTSMNGSQFSLALTVSYAEMSVLSQLNDSVPENPQLCNRFSYVANNPLGFTDLSGYDPDPIPPWRRVASKLCGIFAAATDTVAWIISGAGALLEGAGAVGVPLTVGEEPLTFSATVITYNVLLNPFENAASSVSLGFTALGDWLSGASYIDRDPLTVVIGQDTAASYIAMMLGSGLPLTPEAFTDFLANTAVLAYDYGRLLELIPTGYEIRVIGVTEDGLDILEIVPVEDK